VALLSDLRVVSIALNVPGPLAVARLRDEGASIVKVEPPTGDPLQQYSRGWYDELHRGIHVERVDLKSDQGKAQMGERLAEAQLLVSSQRPSALARLQLDASSLTADARTAHLRILNLVGERAHPEHAGHDLTYLAGTGLLGSELPRTLMADVMGSERAFSAALLLLREPPGSHVQVGLTDGLEPLAAPWRHGLTRPDGMLGGGLPAYGVYHASNGRIAVAALEPHFRERLYSALELPLDGALDDAFRGRGAEEWEAWARDLDLPIAKIHH
jgi:crotonobetainyl-CoA:carnitine CoA-transferase CaiB-like acyl-CoA transferase